MNFKNIKHKLVDPLFIGILGLAFLLISFLDVLVVTDAGSISEMTPWGKVSVGAFLLVLAWLSVFMIVLPTLHHIFKKKKEDKDKRG